MSIRRSKTMPTDGPTTKFLYTIIKQLDLKSIDWSLVASQLDISNGHAARMRFSRFKQQMEGTTSTPRAARPKKPGSKMGNEKRGIKNSLQKTPISPPPLSPNIKQEQSSAAAYDPSQSPYLKTDPYLQNSLTLEEIPQAESRTPIPRSYIPPQMQAQFQHFMYPQQSMYQRRLPQQIHYQRPMPSYQQQLPFTPYNPYSSHMTVSPADLNVHSSSFVPSITWGEAQSPVQHSWQPVKQDGEDDGRKENELVKIE